MVNVLVPLILLMNINRPTAPSVGAGTVYVRPEAEGEILKLVYISTVVAAEPMDPPAKSPKARVAFLVEPLFVKVPDPPAPPTVRLAPSVLFPTVTVAVLVLTLKVFRLDVF
jgi:hypothetical protein